MSMTDYSQARKLALKTFRQDLSSRRTPYLQVLDDLLPFVEIAGEQDLGLIEIPAEHIIGTKSTGRTRAFASNFMPLLDEKTEFAAKWSSLYDSHLEEGIKEPVVACEFLNRYYIIEGNKRVSVLKFSGAVSIPGYVTRIVPALTDEPEVKAYYEFMEFYRASKLNLITLSRPGSFHDLCRLVGKPFGEPWTREERESFSSNYLFFADAYEKRGGKKIPITTGDAFLFYLNIYGYEGMDSRSFETIKKELEPLWSDLEALPTAQDVNVVMQPEEVHEKNLLKKLIAPVTGTPVLTVGFIHYKTAKASSWTYGHELGRHYLEDSMAGKIRMKVYDGIETDEQCFAAITRAIEDGCAVLFTTSPRFLGPSLKAGMIHPEIKILNCSLNAYSGHLRTYYGRLYEAKFLVGVLAGILTTTDHVGYIADFPIYGTPASINAFALGVKTVNPAAKIHLAWATKKDCDINLLFQEAKVSHVSGRDMITPLHSTRRYGLYDLADDGKGVLASSMWNWGKFYQRILQTILNGSWNRTASNRSINYWWGISSGMIDLITSNDVPERTMGLVNLFRKQIVNGEFQIFSGNLYDQNGVLRNEGNEVLTPEEIIRMDWLLDNVVGAIPALSELMEEALPMVRIQGIYDTDQLQALEEL